MSSSASAPADALALLGPGVFAYGLGALAFLAFALHLAAGRRGGPKAMVLLATIAASLLWAGLNLAFALTERTVFWLGQSLVDALRLSGWLLFLSIVLGGWRQARHWSLSWALLPLATWFFPLAAPAGEYAALATHTRLAFGVLLAVAVAGLVLSEQVFRRAPAQSRWAVKPLCLGLGGAFAFDLYAYSDALLFGRLDAHVWAARGIAQALVIPFIALATVRNKDWTIDIAVSRGVVFHSTAFLASGLYLLAVAAAGYYVRYFGGTWGKTFQIGFIFAALLLLGWLFSSGKLRSQLKVFINKNFFSYRYDYRQEWLRFTNLLSTRDPQVSPAQRSIQALADLVESPAGALWLRRDDGVFTQAARWNFPEVRAQEGADQPLPRFLAGTRWVVNLSQYRERPAAYPELELPPWLQSLPSAWLVVPIIALDELTGFLVLATSRAQLEVNWEVLDLLKTAARQAGSFLAQARASEALLEARKFEAFNRMSAFVVHDLKNLVAQLSLLLKNAERHRHNPRFQADMVSTIEHVAERMSKLLVQLGAGARGDETLRPIALRSLVNRVIEAKRDERSALALEATDEVMALVHEQRFERIIGHLIQNAIDATRAGGGVLLRVSGQGACAIVEVADSGCGMSEEFVREKLFRPFHTTKPNGMGIGAYEAAQYVREIGGRIEAESKPLAGTRINVILPLYREHGQRAEPLRQVA